MRTCAALLGLLLLAAAAVAAQAQERRLPRGEEMGTLPIEILADRLSADSVKNSVTFEGNVVAKQGDVTLRADRLFAEYTRAAGAIEKIVAEGNVLVTQSDREVRAARADFFNMEQRIVLSGGADLTQGGNTVRGDTVTVFLRENRSVVTGGEGGRVKAVLHPKGVPGKTEKIAP